MSLPCASLTASQVPPSASTILASVTWPAGRGRGRVTLSILQHTKSHGALQCNNAGTNSVTFHPGILRESMHTWG